MMVVGQDCRLCVCVYVGVCCWVQVDESKYLVAIFFLRAPFGQYGPVAAFELYLYAAVDSRPGPGGSRTTASCQP